MVLPVQDSQNVQQIDNAPANKPPEGTPTSAEPKITPPVEDIVTRASQVSLEDKGKPQVSDQDDILKGSGFDRNQWNDMLAKLPEDQKQQLESAYKSLQKGANEKFQTASEKLKQAETMRQQPWTTDRVSDLMQDPAFIQAAQTYTQSQAASQNPQDSGLNDQEWSALSDSDKRQFHQMAQNQQVLKNQMNTMMINQEDERLKDHYKNYDAIQVKQLRQDLLSGRVQAQGEHLWKVLDYDGAVERAYQLGLNDRQKDLREKQDASSVGVGGVNIQPAGEVPTKQPNESTVDLFKRIALNNIQKLRQAQSVQRQ